jgi:formate hydrogenlyase subunit 3/multisubunit Na+/H+ antiporter MnhD subunit
MLVLSRSLFFISLLAPLLLLGNSGLGWNLQEHFPLIFGICLQSLVGFSIFLFTIGENSHRKAGVSLGYSLFFIGLSGSYFSGRSLFLPFFWELSSLGAFLVYTSIHFNLAKSKSIISLYIASGASGIFLASWIFLPENHAIGNLFLLLALLLKSAFSVLHLWYPDLHEGAPTSASASFSGIAINLPILLFVHYFQPNWMSPIAYKIMVPLAGIGIFLGGVTAFFSKDIKKILAYSTIEKVNFLWLCLFLYKLWIQGMETEMVFFAKVFLLLFYITLLHHSISKSYQFLIFGHLRDFADSNSIDAAKGVGRISGIPFMLLGYGTFSFVLLPGTLGFISEATYLYLISRIVDLDSGKSIVILPAMVIFIIGLALGSMAHSRLFLTLSLSVPNDELKKRTESKGTSKYIIYSLIYLSILLTFIPIFLSGFLSFSNFFSIDSGLSKWFLTLFNVSIISLIFYFVMIYGKFSHRIERRVLWDCGNNYRGSELSIPGSVISEPLHDSLGITTNMEDGESNFDSWLKKKILSLLKLGKIWISEVESGDISNYIAFSSTSLLITLGILVLYRFYKDSTWNILTILF